MEAVTAVFACHSLTVESLAASLTGEQRRALDIVREISDEKGQKVYLVGGPVRDALLGFSVVDLDFSVEGDAVALARVVATNLGGKVTAHSRFGTATVELRQCGGAEEVVRVDLVTARRESYPRPGQLPVVEPGTIADDLARRDFSINAMALPLASGGEALQDPHGGLDDLKAGVVRVLHPGSFADDPTRMMRAVRYEQRFGFGIAPDTLKLLAGALADGCMATVSGDRWRHELEKVFEEANPAAAIRRAAELGLMAGLHPAFEQLGDSGHEVFRRLDAIWERSGHLSGGMCLAALFSRFNPAEGESVAGTLRLTGPLAAIARDTIVLRNSEPVVRAVADRPSALARALSGLNTEAVEAWAELTGDATVADALRRYLRELLNLKPALTGNDFLELGAVEGPMVGELLEILREARLDGLVSSDEEERTMARDLVAQKLAEDTE